MVTFAGSSRHRLMLLTTMTTVASSSWPQLKRGRIPMCRRRRGHTDLTVPVPPKLRSAAPARGCRSVGWAHRRRHRVWRGRGFFIQGPQFVIAFLEPRACATMRQREGGWGGGGRPRGMFYLPCTIFEKRWHGIPIAKDQKGGSRAPF